MCLDKPDKPCGYAIALISNELISKTYKINHVVYSHEPLTVPRFSFLLQWQRNNIIPWCQETTAMEMFFFYSDKVGSRDACFQGLLPSRSREALWLKVISQVCFYFAP
jgi:hypothetical protein